MPSIKSFDYFAKQEYLFHSPKVCYELDNTGTPKMSKSQIAQENFLTDKEQYALKKEDEKNKGHYVEKTEDEKKGYIKMPTNSFIPKEIAKDKYYFLRQFKKTYYMPREDGEIIEVELKAGEIYTEMPASEHYNKLAFRMYGDDMFEEYEAKDGNSHSQPSILKNIGFKKAKRYISAADLEKYKSDIKKIDDERIGLREKAGSKKIILMTSDEGRRTKEYSADIYFNARNKPTDGDRILFSNLISQNLIDVIDIEMWLSNTSGTRDLTEKNNNLHDWLVMMKQEVQKIGKTTKMFHFKNTASRAAYRYPNNYDTNLYEDIMDFQEGTGVECFYSEVFDQNLNTKRWTRTALEYFDLPFKYLKVDKFLKINTEEAKYTENSGYVYQAVTGHLMGTKYRDYAIISNKKEINGDNLVQEYKNFSDDRKNHLEKHAEARKNAYLTEVAEATIQSQVNDRFIEGKKCLSEALLQKQKEEEGTYRAQLNLNKHNTKILNIISENREVMESFAYLNEKCIKNIISTIEKISNTNTLKKEIEKCKEQEKLTPNYEEQLKLVKKRWSLENVLANGNYGIMKNIFEKLSSLGKLGKEAIQSLENFSEDELLKLLSYVRDEHKDEIVKKQKEQFEEELEHLCSFMSNFPTDLYIQIIKYTNDTYNQLYDILDNNKKDKIKAIERKKKDIEFYKRHYDTDTYENIKAQRKEIEKLEAEIITEEEQIKKRYEQNYNNAINKRIQDEIQKALNNQNKIGQMLEGDGNSQNESSRMFSKDDELTFKEQIKSLKHSVYPELKKLGNFCEKYKDRIGIKLFLKQFNSICPFYLPKNWDPKNWNPKYFANMHSSTFFAKIVEHMFMKCHQNVFERQIENIKAVEARAHRNQMIHSYNSNEPKNIKAVKVEEPHNKMIHSYNSISNEPNDIGDIKERISKQDNYLADKYRENNNNLGNGANKARVNNRQCIDLNEVGEYEDININNNDASLYIDDTETEYNLEYAKQMGKQRKEVARNKLSGGKRGGDFDYSNNTNNNNINDANKNKFGKIISNINNMITNKDINISNNYDIVEERPEEEEEEENVNRNESGIKNEIINNIDISNSIKNKSINRIKNKSGHTDSNTGGSTLQGTRTSRLINNNHYFNNDVNANRTAFSINQNVKFSMDDNVKDSKKSYKSNF